MSDACLESVMLFPWLTRVRHKYVRLEDVSVHLRHQAYILRLSTRLLQGNSVLIF